MQNLNIFNVALVERDKTANGFPNNWANQPTL